MVRSSHQLLKQVTFRSQPEPVSPQKGKNHLVRFINRSQAVFNKIAQGKLVAHYHTHFLAHRGCVQEQGTLFGSYAKTELEEYQVVTAIGQIQNSLPKRLVSSLVSVIL